MKDIIKKEENNKQNKKHGTKPN